MCHGYEFEMLRAAYLEEFARRKAEGAKSRATPAPAPAKDADPAPAVKDTEPVPA